MRDVWESLVLVLVVFLAFGFCMGGVIGANAIYDHKICDHIAAVNTDLEFHWEFWTSCMVKMPDGIWYSTSSVQYVGLEEE